MGNWASEVIRKKVNADVGLQNDGGLRINIPAGTITAGTIFNLMPFDNDICTINMTKASWKKF